MLLSPLFIPLPPQIRAAAAALACEASASRSSSGEEKLTFFQNCIPGAVRLSRTAHNRFKRFSRGAAKVLNELRVLKEENKSVLLIGTLPASGNVPVGVVVLPSLPASDPGTAASRASTSLQHFLRRHFSPNKQFEHFHGRTAELNRAVTGFSTVAQVSETTRAVAVFLPRSLYLYVCVCGPNGLAPC